MGTTTSSDRPVVAASCPIPYRARVDAPTRPAPIAVFAYKRPEHLRRLLQSLKHNPEAAHSKIVAFSDGPRSEADRPLVEATRNVLLDTGLPDVEIVCRERNMGLAANVIDGVTKLCREHGRVIVLEDDLVLAPTFLAYMNSALERYEREPQVFQVAGFMYPVDLRAQTDSVFLPFISSWGWGTWARAWERFDASAAGYARVAADRRVRRRFDLDGNYYFFDMLRRQAAGEINSWAIRWYLSVFVNNGLALFPSQSLVQNEGFGSDATHCVGSAPAHALARATAFRVQSFPSVGVDPSVLRRVSRFMGHDRTFAARVRKRIQRMLRGTRL
jgi:hypothetical protein